MSASVDATQRGPDSLRFLKFVVASGLAAAANIGARALCSTFAPYAVAVALAFGVGLATAFVLNRRYVFVDAGGSVREQTTWFVLVNLVGLAQTLVVSVGVRWLLHALGVDFHVDLIAHALGVVTPIATSYIGHSRLSFAPRARAGA